MIRLRSAALTDAAEGTSRAESKGGRSRTSGTRSESALARSVSRRSVNERARRAAAGLTATTSSRIRSPAGVEASQVTASLRRGVLAVASCSTRAASRARAGSSSSTAIAARRTVAALSTASIARKRGQPAAACGWAPRRLAMSALALADSAVSASAGI